MGDRSVSRTLKGILDDLDVHQPLIIDLRVLKGYCEDLAVAKFLSGLNPLLVTQVRGQILRSNNVLSLSSSYSKKIWVLIPSASTASSTSLRALNYGHWARSWPRLWTRTRLRQNHGFLVFVDSLDLIRCHDSVHIV